MQRISGNLKTVSGVTKSARVRESVQHWVKSVQLCSIVRKMIDALFFYFEVMLVALTILRPAFKINLNARVRKDNFGRDD